MKRRASAILAAGVMIACGADALGQRQLLDLSGAAAPPPAGTGAGAVALAEELGFQATAMDRTGDPRDRARAAVRRLAAKLLTTGERAGAAGSARVVIGRTLAGGMAETDRAIGQIEGVGAAGRLAVIEGDAASATRTLDSPGAEPWRLTRDALALVAQETVAGGANPPARPPIPLADRAAEWSGLPGVRPDIARTLASLDAVLTPADGWASYRPSAHRVRALVTRAGEALGELPAWAPAPSRERLGEDFTRAVEGLLVREEQAGAEAKLERIARLGALATRTDALDAGTAGQRARTALAQTMGIPVADPVGERRALESYERALTLATTRFAPEEDRTLPRPLRPAWRALAAMYKQGEAPLYGVLPELIRRPEAMTEPGIVATLNTQQRLADDLRALQSLGRTLAGGPAAEGKEPEVQPAWSKLAGRVLTLGQNLTKPTLREPALRALRTLLTQTGAYTSIPGESRLTDEAWSALVGGRGPALKEAIDRHRAAWLASLEKGEPVAEDASRLGAIRELLETVSLLDALAPAALPGATSPAYDRLQSEPPWELSPAALAELATGVPEQLAEAARAAIEDSPDKAAEILRKFRHEHAVLMLAGRLALTLREQPVSPAPGPLLQIASGTPPRGSWLGDHAPELLGVCRYAEEAPVARRTAEKSIADADLAYANRLAERLLETLKP